MPMLDLNMLSTFFSVATFLLKMSFFGLGQSADIKIHLPGIDKREKVCHGENKEMMVVYYDGETVCGTIDLAIKSGKLEHKGIKVELVGQIEILYDRSSRHDFINLVKQLSPAGTLTQNKSFSFEFPHVEKPYESYVSSNVRLRYFLRVTIGRRLSDQTKEQEFAVHMLSAYPEQNNSLKMEVGIEDCLHIEFEYNKQKYHLHDAIIGKIYYLLVRVKIKHMEIHVIKRETMGSGPSVFHDEETIAKYEIMDGAPVKGESIPIRLFLAAYNLTPTMRDIYKKFSVHYLLNLVLIDEEERRYFKQQEITLWRKGDSQHLNASRGIEDSTQRFAG